MCVYIYTYTHTHTHNVIPKVNTERSIQGETLKNIIDKSKWNSKNIKEDREVITKNKGKNKSRNKVTDLSSNILIIKLDVYSLHTPIKRHIVRVEK